MRPDSLFRARFLSRAVCLVVPCHLLVMGGAVACSHPSAQGQPAREPGHVGHTYDSSGPPPASTTAELSNEQHPLLDDRAADPRARLPELHFKHLGMHIGGESNTPEAKEPFLSAIMDQEEPILLCYRWVDEPMQGGSFGIDLLVPTSGGGAEVHAVRTKLGTDRFVECMTRAIGGVMFPPQKRPIMLSYSLLFVLD